MSLELHICQEIISTKTLLLSIYALSANLKMQREYRALGIDHQGACIALAARLMTRWNCSMPKI